MLGESERELSRLRECLEVRGFDLVSGFDAVAFNSSTSETFRLETFGRPNVLGLVVGHTRRLWSVFLERYNGVAALQTSQHPLDQYTELCVDEVLVGASAGHQVYFGHRSEPAYVPLQRLAAFSGLAELAPCHLNVHETHGPWIALRAAVTFDLPALPAIRRSSSHCSACWRPCMPALAKAMQQADPAQRETYLEAWLAVREACPVGRQSRYGPQEARYHYLKDREALLELATLSAAKLPT